MNPSDKLEQLQKAAANLVSEREWQQFHTPKNTCAKIAIESVGSILKKQLLQLLRASETGGS